MYVRYLGVLTETWTSAGLHAETGYRTSMAEFRHFA